jgi:hypothetical protein
MMGLISAGALLVGLMLCGEASVQVQDQSTEIQES